MRRWVPLVLLSVTCSASSAWPQAEGQLRAVRNTSGQGAATADLDAAATLAGRGFDQGAHPAGGEVVSPPALPLPEDATQPATPAANLIVGTPGRRELREPRNPLTSDGKAKTQKSGNRLWWALGGAAAGGALGFFLGGPIGAAIGAVLGAALGYFFGP